MEALFLKLVNMSITASWLVLAIIAVRLVFKKAPKWILCLLWGLVAVRLICPFSIESSLSLIPDPEPLSHEQVYITETVKQAHGEILDSEGNVIVERHPAVNGDILNSEGNIIVEVQDGHRTYPEEEQAHGWTYTISRIWVIGFCVMLTYTAVSYYLLKKKVATAIPLKRGIKQSEYVDSPFVLGIVRPVIYLPFDMAEADCAYVIAHEKAHIRRRDHWWKPLGFLLLSIYWFNPVLWAAYILLCRDIEAACDEKVIKDMKKDDRRAYSTALLNCSIHRRSIAACPLAFGETGVKTRVKGIMNYRKPAFWVILIALLICIVISICFLTDPSGMHLYEIDDSRNYSDLFTNTDDITLIREGEEYPIYDTEELLKQLDEVKVRKLTLNRSRSEDRDKTNRIQLREKLYLNFSWDYTHVWIDNLVKPTYTYRVINPDQVRTMFETLTGLNRKLVAQDVVVEDDIIKELELIKDPIASKVVYRWDVNGNSIYDDTLITSFILRPMSATITCDQEEVAPNFLTMGDRCVYVIMKDGTKISLRGKNAHSGIQNLKTETSIDLSKVVSVLMPDGTKINVPSDNVYTWFDKSSTDASERNPKDNLVDLFGMENVSLSYHPDEIAIYLINAEGRKVIVTCDAGIRNVFLTDLTGDGVSEVCATVQDEFNTQVQVYNASEQILYELQAEETGYNLTKKADRLCVYRVDEYGNPVGYWQLTLQPGEGIVLADLDPEVETLKSKLVCVDINTRRRTCLSSAQEMHQIMTLLRDLEDSVVPATAVELEEAENDGFNTTWITVNYELGKKNLFFSKDFDLVWEVGSTEAFRIPDPGLIRQFFEFVTDGVRNRETSGEPFATVDSPWDWCACVNSNAISNAEVCLCLDVTSSGNSVNITGTNGNLLSDSFQRLLPILNQIPQESFIKTDKYTSDYSQFVWGDHLEGSCSVSLIDGVNEMAVVIRTYKGSVEMILTGELDKAQQNDHGYLNTPAVIWTVKNPALRTYLDDVRENTPIINYTVGAEYNWQYPIEFSKGKFNLTLYLTEDWIYEEVNNSTDSGIRCRPKDVEEGWIYFSFWPGGYSAEKEDLHYEERTWNRFPTKIAYPSGVLEKLGHVTRDDVWSFEMVNTDVGDFVIINDGADDWFANYVDQISDTLSLLQFTTE